MPMLHSNTQLHIMVVGNDKSGKSTMISHLFNSTNKKNLLTQYVPTFGQELYHFDLFQGRTTLIEIGGLMPYRSLILEKLIHSVDGLIFILCSKDFDPDGIMLLKKIISRLHSMCPVLLIRNDRKQAYRFLKEEDDEIMNILDSAKSLITIEELSSFNTKALRPIETWIQQLGSD